MYYSQLYIVGHINIHLDSDVYLETMVSRLECTRVHFVQVSVLVSRPEVQGLGLGLKTACLVPTPVARLP